MNVEENLEHLVFQISKLVLRNESNNVLQELYKKEQLNKSCINKLEEDQDSEQKNIIIFLVKLVISWINQGEAKVVYLSIEPKSNKRKQELLSSWTVATEDGKLRDLEVLIQNSEIEDINEVMESNYSLVWSMLETERILLYSKNWEDYKSCLDHKLRKNKKKDELIGDQLEEAVNAKWNEI
ncbi:21902_t:CDS:2, partial [Gigaspora margarita]